jgi:hypothetical protein
MPFPFFKGRLPTQEKFPQTENFPKISFKYCMTELHLSPILVILCLNNQTIGIVKIILITTFWNILRNIVIKIIFY